jgi:hypothetical protein
MLCVRPSRGRPQVPLPSEPLTELLADGDLAGRVDTADYLAACLVYRGEGFPLGGVPGPAKDATLAVFAGL